MTDLSKEYYEKWMDQIRENKRLKSELEKYQKMEERLKDFEWKTEKYKKYFEPLAKQYEILYTFSKALVNYFEKLVKLYNNYILLNPNFKVKLNDEDKNRIIKELQLILLEFIKLKIPKEYDIVRDFTISPKTPKPIKKDFERKNFVVKKNKGNG